MKITKQITFDRMKKNPNNVTIFGANHNGRSCTKPFHYSNLSILFRAFVRGLEAYVVLEDVIRNQRFVDTGIFVRLQMDKSFFRHALMCGLLCEHQFISKDAPSIFHDVNVLLLGAIGVLGVVTGWGSTAWSVLTANKSARGRILNQGSRSTLRAGRQTWAME
jgi:hypothetical protein